jgi:hypothetical protein
MYAKALIAATALIALMPLAARAGEVENRIDDQQARIAQGVRSGSLTYGEYRSVDAGLDRIQAQRNHDLRADGGRLTGTQSAQLNREENHLSDRISFDKHNENRQ